MFQTLSWILILGRDVCELTYYLMLLTCGLLAVMLLLALGAPGCWQGQPQISAHSFSATSPQLTDRTHSHTVTSNRIEQLKMEEMYLGVIHLLTNLKCCYVSGAHDLSSAMRLGNRYHMAPRVLFVDEIGLRYSTASCMHSSNDQCLVTHVDSCTE